jgi:hypothetical protein
MFDPHLKDTALRNSITTSIVFCKYVKSVKHDDAIKVIIETDTVPIRARTNPRCVLGVLLRDIPTTRKFGSLLERGCDCMIT